MEAAGAPSAASAEGAATGRRYIPGLKDKLSSLRNKLSAWKQHDATSYSSSAMSVIEAHDARVAELNSQASKLKEELEGRGTEDQLQRPWVVGEVSVGTEAEAAERRSVAPVQCGAVGVARGETKLPVGEDRISGLHKELQEDARMLRDERERLEVKEESVGCGDLRVTTHGGNRSQREPTEDNETQPDRLEHLESVGEGILDAAKKAADEEAAAVAERDEAVAAAVKKAEDEAAVAAAVKKAEDEAAAAAAAAKKAEDEAAAATAAKKAEDEAAAAAEAAAKAAAAAERAAAAAVAAEKSEEEDRELYRTGPEDAAAVSAGEKGGEEGGVEVTKADAEQGGANVIAEPTEQADVCDKSAGHSGSLPASTEQVEVDLEQHSRPSPSDSNLNLAVGDAGGEEVESEEAKQQQEPAVEASAAGAVQQQPAVEASAAGTVQQEPAVEASAAGAVQQQPAVEASATGEESRSELQDQKRVESAAQRAELVGSGDSGQPQFKEQAPTTLPRHRLQGLPRAASPQRRAIARMQGGTPTIQRTPARHAVAPGCPSTPGAPRPNPPTGGAFQLSREDYSSMYSVLSMLEAKSKVDAEQLELLEKLVVRDDPRVFGAFDVLVKDNDLTAFLRRVGHICNFIQP